MKLNGTLINYFFHCKRQCWLHGNRLNLENNSEDVMIGKVIHELQSEGKDNAEISIDNVKLDKLTKDYLVEIKKSDADIDAAKWQVLLYLKVLKDKGINRKGKLEFAEKNKQNKKIIYVELIDELENKLSDLSKEIQNLLDSKTPPNVEQDSKCKKCAYYEYCYI